MRTKIERVLLFKLIALTRTASGNVASMPSRWTEVCGGIGSQRMQQRKMAPVLKITSDLVICSVFVECRKDKVFCAICEICLKANKSQIIHSFEGFLVHE